MEEALNEGRPMQMSNLTWSYMGIAQPRTTESQAHGEMANLPSQLWWGSGNEMEKPSSGVWGCWQCMGKMSTIAFYTGLFMTWSLLSSRGCFYLDQLNLSPWSSCISWTLPPWLFVCNNPASLSFVHNNPISLFNSVWWTCWVSRVMRFPQMKALAT